MKTEVRWKLPAGVSAGEVKFPAPKREMTGELACYGYVGEVMLPVMLTVTGALPKDAEIEATVSWLACDEKGCASGEVTVNPVASASDATRAAAVAMAFAALPVVDEKLKLQVTETDGWVELSLTGAEHLDLDGAEIFPVTEQALDPRAPIVWKNLTANAQARVKKMSMPRPVSPRCNWW